MEILGRMHVSHSQRLAEEAISHYTCLLALHGIGLSEPHLVKLLEIPVDVAFDIMAYPTRSNDLHDALKGNRAIWKKVSTSKWEWLYILGLNLVFGETRKIAAQVQVVSQQHDEEFAFESQCNPKQQSE